MGTAGTANREASSDARVWFQAIRFHSFTASAIPIGVGSALALVDGAFSWWLGLLMLLASMACHAGANLANDYYDHQKGIDTAESLGPSKVIQLGLLTPRQVQRGMLMAFAIAAILAVPIVLSAGWPIFLLTLLSLGAAFCYTAGSKALGYIALGELTVFIFMGPVMVCGAYYVLTGELTGEAFLVSLPIGSLAAAILHANNIRDMDLDKAAGKLTLALVIGRRNATIEYVVLISGAYLAIAALVLMSPPLWPTAVVAIMLPAAFRLIQAVSRQSDPMQLNRLLRKTAGLHLQFGVLLIAALCFRALLDRI